MTLLSELDETPGGKLCVIWCASARLSADRYDVMKSIRELITNGVVMCGQLRCSSCYQMDLVAFRRSVPRFGEGQLPAD